MLYRLDPTPAIVDPSWVAKPSGLTTEQLDAITKTGDEKLATEGMAAQVGGPIASSVVNASLRISNIGWLPPSAANTWIYQAVGLLVQEANAMHWNAAIDGFIDQLQYTTYAENGHYTWHQDKYPGPRSQRKLGFSLLLSEPSEYDGGDFEINDGQHQILTHKARGTFIVFPSYVLHRVHPVTRGLRKTLVGWIAGPRWH